MTHKEKESTGKTLLEALNSLTPPQRAIDLPLRIPILTVHKISK